MICAVISHMEQHLPQEKLFVFSFCERFFEEHLVPQRCEIVAHGLLNVVPIHTNAFPIVKVSRIERFWNCYTSQAAEPCIVRANEMNDLISHRSMRVVHILRELLMG